MLKLQFISIIEKMRDWFLNQNLDFFIYIYTKIKYYFVKKGLYEVFSIAYCQINFEYQNPSFLIHSN